MSKNIVICADGTWNRPSAHTNVNSLFNILPGSPDSIPRSAAIDTYVYRNDPAQISFYLEGVGARASRNDLLAGATGTGLHAKVLDGYLLLSRVYEPGDKLFLFGFSRGAYTVRSLAALVAKVGLLPRHLAYDAACRDLANQIWWTFKYREGGMQANAPDADDPHPIRLIGVWDTVGALGIPFFNGVNVVDELERHLFDFADCNLSERVEYGLHALAIDERRLDFEPALWTPRQGVTQAWFPGVHSDVGGGYPFRRLADISLTWMRDLAVDKGLVAEPLDCPALDPLANRHESADSLVWNLRRAPRTIAESAQFHACVEQRFAGRADYRPQALARHPRFRKYYTSTAPSETICEEDSTTPTPPLKVGDSRKFVVLAEKWWNGVGLSVGSEEVYDIVATGTWNDAEHYCNADGWKGFELFGNFKRLPERDWFYLCMSVSPEPDLECNNADFAKGLSGMVGRLDDGSHLFPIGCGARVTTARSGYVYFFANDAPACYGNNLGYRDVVIKRVA